MSAKTIAIQSVENLREEIDARQLATMSDPETLWIVAYSDGVECGIGTRDELLGLLDVFGATVYFRKAI